ncbi:MAG: Coenzyme F420 hydrogenase/dehydrogenase, beta subunit C-terminal domain, partial [Clostridia bacterium]
TNNEKIKKKVYLAFSNDRENLIKSSSGGMFSEIAKIVLEEKGIVFGAKFNENMVLKHSYIENINELDKLRGSKYVQSNIGDSYIKVKEFLDKEKKVLFVGTPCQVNGLKAFLNCKQENLITIDLICHGVPSLKIFKEYLKTLKINNMTDFKFRYKIKNNVGYGFAIFNKNKKIKHYKGNYTSYGYAFLNGMIQRKSCYNCKFADIDRVSDITLGDYWQEINQSGGITNNEGISLMIINSKEGDKIFNKIKKNIVYVPTNLELAKKSNIHLTKSINENPKRDKIYNELGKSNFNKIAKKYIYPDNIYIIRIKELIPKKIKSLVKR